LQLLNPFEIQIDMKDIQLQINIQESDIFKCDILWTLEALSNILKNCIEHVE
jgi:nitrogen fixation/metabolism regulation signal transduction histidine kinase